MNEMRKFPLLATRLDEPLPSIWSLLAAAYENKKTIDVQRRGSETWRGKVLQLGSDYVLVGASSSSIAIPLASIDGITGNNWRIPNE